MLADICSQKVPSCRGCMTLIFLNILLCAAHLNANRHPTAAEHIFVNSRGESLLL